MPSEKHDFIVSAIVRKIKKEGYQIFYMEGKYQDISLTKYDIPPKIINHRPDVIAKKDDNKFCIGEAKTKSDLITPRTKKQIEDFFSLVKLNKDNKLFIGVPLGAKENLEKLLRYLSLFNRQQIEILYIPDTLLPNEEEI